MLAEAGDLKLRTLRRDGQEVCRGGEAGPAESTNSDIVTEFLNLKDGRRGSRVPWRSSTRGAFKYLYHYVEYPAICHKERLAKARQVVGMSRDR